jgi:predicted dehydrogenase
MSVSLGLIGCGHIHITGFIKMLKGRSDVKVKSVWDHDATRGQTRADELGARFFADYRAILSDTEIGGVIVASETNQHEALVPPIVAAKKHLFVEKPLGFAAKDAYAMADAIEAAGLKFQTGYFMRGSPVVQFLKQQVDAGVFGKITRVRGSNCHGGALGGWFDSKPADVANDWRWMADPKISGCGAFGDLGTHPLDILLWMFGQVSAVTAQIDRGTARYAGCDETGEGLLRFKSGAIGTLAAAWDDVANPVSFIISGTEGHAAVINHELFFNCKAVEGADGKTAWTKLPAGLPHAFELFLDALVGKNVPLVGAREAAYRNAVMEALYQGAKSEKWVAVER